MQVPCYCAALRPWLRHNSSIRGINLDEVVPMFLVGDFVPEPT